MVERYISATNKQVLTVIHQNLQLHRHKFCKGRSPRQHLLGMRMGQHCNLDLIGLEQTGCPRQFVGTAHHGTAEGQFVAQYRYPCLSFVITGFILQRCHDLHIALAKNIPKAVGGMCHGERDRQPSQSRGQAQASQERTSLHV